MICLIACESFFACTLTDVIFTSHVICGAHDAHSIIVFGTEFPHYRREYASLLIAFVFFAIETRLVSLQHILNTSHHPTISSSSEVRNEQLDICFQNEIETPVFCKGKDLTSLVCLLAITRFRHFIQVKAREFKSESYIYMM